jgi:hypothetical protein
MQEQSNPEPEQCPQQQQAGDEQEESSCGARLPSEVIEQDVFMMLTVGDEQRPWSVRELEQEFGDRVAVGDGLEHLHHAGLVHRCGEFVWATRATMHAKQVSM